MSGNEKRRRDGDEENFRASTAIITAQVYTAAMKRQAEELGGDPRNNIIKTTVACRGEITRDVLTRRLAFNPSEAMVDAIDAVSWQQVKDVLRELKMPVIRMNEGDRRSIHASVKSNTLQEDSSFGKLGNVALNT